MRSLDSQIVWEEPRHFVKRDTGPRQTAILETRFLHVVATVVASFVTCCWVPSALSEPRYRAPCDDGNACTINEHLEAVS